MIGKLILKFIKGFVCKYFGTVVIENIVIILLEQLVKATDSKVDDKIFNEVFGKVNKGGDINVE